ncbi:MAG: acyl-CoA dehydratase activase-related protein [Chitinispirillales bacterium]|jgi:predicted nucleotide-binding protein (sugar kinase/HSP70/actin superfamily)|nr:acyl-CoA dehydratase activase-related protein [Chitinispirillales bacterium]
MNKQNSKFVGFENLRNLTYDVSDGDRCPYCANACSRSVLRFSNSEIFVTGNRCEKGENVDGKKAPQNSLQKKVPDMMQEREAMIFKNYNKEFPAKTQKGSIGIPVVLDFYDSLPFWGTLFAALGYKVELSERSSAKIFEKGLSTIPSDTICLPAKMVHGHIKLLIEKGVNMVFFPSIHKNIKTNPTADSSWNCAVLMGYPEVIKIQEKLNLFEIKYLSPAFRWTAPKLKKTQIISFLINTLGESNSSAQKALKFAEIAAKKHKNKLFERGKEILDEIKKSHGFGVLLSGRPYHGDSFINHGVSNLFTANGIPVLINECIDLDKIDVSTARIDTYNTFHTRMVAAAMAVADNERLELVQLVSFGCGHDAVLTDEIDRILRAKSQKAMLSLKLDEGENKGPLSIRITSFIETIKIRKKERFVSTHKNFLPPYKKIYGKEDRNRIILIPNLSSSFSILMEQALKAQNYETRILPVADKKAIELGKKYVHNDICFPAQVNIGEHLRYLYKYKNKKDSFSVMIAKNCQDCRAGHYAALTRKALDANGFEDVPILTTDFGDKRNIHPGFKISELKFSLFSIKGMALIDAIDDMTRKCRPYERDAGTCAILNEKWCRILSKTLREKGWRASLKQLEFAIKEFNENATDRSIRKPRVGIIGEILVNYHETGNYKIVEYLEEHGMEIILPAIAEFWRQNAVNFRTMSNRGHSRSAIFRRFMGFAYEKAFDIAINPVEKRMKKFKYYEPHSNIFDMAQYAKEIFDIAFFAGEGWLIPGEIISWIKKGVNAHLIIQPFGCLPNHITGRGVVKAIKEKYPGTTILSLDFDPDTSLANIHNRMQMIILNAK